MRQSLTAGWTLRAAGGEVPPAIVAATVPATVPGCVHLDLMSAGLIPDPYLDQNEALVQWIASADWEYSTTFDWVPATVPDCIDLVAAGLDTVATVELNGTVVAQTRNMHRSYRWDISELVRVWPNQLVIRFRSALLAARQASEELGPRPATVPHPINAIRKMACNFGADWGPELITAGIWRPLQLETWRSARIAAARPSAELDGDSGVLRVRLELQREAGLEQPLSARVRIAGTVTEVAIGAGEVTVDIQMAVPEVAPWWPVGYGDQPLYPVTISLHDAAGTLDEKEVRVGFRTVSADVEPDEHGTPFTLRVNDRPIFARGVNWIPNDAFPSRVGPAEYRQRLEQARNLNANLVRVWGGGVFEDDAFYDICDELGLLVWQDFMFNCACYAEEDPLRDEILAEARDAVTRLSPHPSLAVWNGCNENLWGHWDWDWQEPLGELTWGAAYYFEWLPALLAELDPTRPYLPGSPYSMSRERHPLDPAHGTMHIWDVWNRRDYTAYRDYVPRFCSEFGFQGPPTWATLDRISPGADLTSTSPVLLAHEKAVDGMEKLERGLAGHLPAPASFENWHWAMSLNQARAISYGVEHFRSWMPICMGTVVWQLNDCWPVISWSAVDGDGRRKPMWYALRSSYRDRLLTIQPRGLGLALVAINDSDEHWTATLRSSRRDFDGTVRAAASMPLDVAARSAITLTLPLGLVAAEDPGAEVLLAECDDVRAWWHFSEDVDSTLPAPRLDVELTAHDQSYTMTVTALTFIRDLAVLIDRIDPNATVDDMLITLLPGEAARFEILSATPLSVAALSDPAVLRSANQLVVL